MLQIFEFLNRGIGKNLLVLLFRDFAVKNLRGVITQIVNSLVVII